LRNNRGFALALTLWILAALVVLAAGLGMMARTEAQISRNFGDAIRCRWAARAGVNAAVAEAAKLGGSPQTYLGEIGGTVSSEAQDVDLGEASFEAQVQDEAGKVNINTAPRSVLEALFGSREIADCIVDWRDDDDQPEALGAEARYYSGLRDPYRPRNGPFVTVGELLLVRGVTEELLSAPIGEDGRPLKDMLTVYSTDQNVAVDGKERMDIRTAGRDQLKSRLGDVLTDQDLDDLVKWRDSRKPNSAGEVVLVQNLPRDKVERVYDRITASEKKTLPGLINVNTAPVDVLAALPGMDRSTAEDIVARRTQEGPYADVGALLGVKTITAEVFAECADMLTVRSRVFEIAATGRIGSDGPSRTVTCVVDVSKSDAARVIYWRE